MVSFHIYVSLQEDTIWLSSYTFRTGGHGPCCTYYVGMGDFPQLRSSATGYQQKGHLPTTANWLAPCRRQPAPLCLAKNIMFQEVCNEGNADKSPNLEIHNSKPIR